MKNKLIIILVIAAIALLVADGLLWMGYLRERQAGAGVAAQLAEAESNLAGIPQPPAGLEQKLAEAEAKLAAVQADFPKDRNSTRMINAMLKLADECQVKAIPLVTQPWARETVGQGSYDVFRMKMDASGSFTHLTSFISRLESGEFASLVIEGLSVKSTEDGATASLELAIYARPATSEQGAYR